VRKDWDVEGMPVTGSSLVFKCEMVQLGVIRRSDEINGGADGVSPGTVICSEISWAVSNDMLV
jgi:hypothetical protein